MPGLLQMIGFMTGGLSERTLAVVTQADIRGFNKPNSLGISLLDRHFLGPMSTTVWNKLKGIRVLCYNQNDVSDFTRLNLKDPANNLATVNGGLSYDYGGWTGDGATGWWDQNYNPVSAANGYTQNSAFQAFFVRKRSETSNNALAGQVTATTTQIRNALSANQRLNSGADLSATRDLSGEGFKAINRPDANNLNTYADLVKNDIARTSFTLPNENMTLFRFNAVYGNMQLSFNAWGEAMLESEVNELRNRFNSYYKAIWEINMVGVMKLYSEDGQSNKTGRALNSAIAPELAGKVGAKVFALKPGPFPGSINSTSEFEELELGVNNTTESLGVYHGSEMRFGYEMFNNVTEDIGIVKFGIGGTSMATSWLNGGTGDVVMKRILFNYAINYIRDVLRLRIEWRGHTFIQGESDCVGGLGALYGTRYNARIVSMLDYAENVGLNSSKLRWLDFLTKNGGSAGYTTTDYNNVIAGKIDTITNFLTVNPTYANKIKGLSYQSTDDVPLLDTQHYSTVGLDTIGQREYEYFSQFAFE